MLTGIENELLIEDISIITTLYIKIEFMVSTLYQKARELLEVDMIMIYKVQKQLQLLKNLISYERVD